MPVIDTLDDGTLLTVDNVVLKAEVNKEDDYEGWKEARKDKLTGSRAYLETGLYSFDEEPEERSERRMLIGSLLEGAIYADPDLRKEWSKLWPECAFVWNKKDWFFTHPDFPSCGATPDVLVINKRQRCVGTIELKFQQSQWSTHWPPLHYLLQAAFTAEVLQVEGYALSCWYPAVGTFWYQTLPVYAPLADRTGPYLTANYMTPDGYTSVRDLMEQWEHMDLMGHRWTHLDEHNPRFSRQNDDGVNVFQADPVLEETLRLFHQTNIDYNALAKQRKALRQNIMEASYDGEHNSRITGSEGETLATIKQTEYYRLDGKKLEEDHPDIHWNYNLRTSRTTLKTLLP